MTIQYVLFTRIAKVEEKKETLRVIKDPNDPQSKNVIKVEKSLGWFILLEGTLDWRFMGDSQPIDLKPGKQVKLTLEVVG